MLLTPSLRREQLQRRTTRPSAALLRQAEDSLRHPDAGVRVVAIAALGNAGLAALPALEFALEDEHPAVRAKAVEILGHASATAVLPLLSRALRDRDAHVRIAAATALGDYGCEAAPAIADLVHALGDVNMIFSRLAAQALSRIGASAVPALVAALQSSDINVRREAAWALGQIGTAAADALPILEQMRENSTPAPAPTKPTDQTLRMHAETSVVIIGSSASKGRVSEDAAARLRAAVARAIDRIRGQRVGDCYP